MKKNILDLMKKNTVWGENRITEMNSNLAFCLSEFMSGKVKIYITSSAIYRISINGKFLGYGPARSAHGYSRVDEYSVVTDGKTNIVVEAVNYNVNSYYLIKQNAFFSVVVEIDDKAMFTSDDFVCYDLTDRVKKVQRFSFQRPFVEVYRDVVEREKMLAGLKPKFPEITKVNVNCPKLLDRGVLYPFFDEMPAICLEKGAVIEDDNRPAWEDWSIDTISEKQLGYKYNELEFFLSDDCSKFTYKKEKEIFDKNITIDKKQYGVFKFARNVSGFFKLDVFAYEKTRVYLTFDEQDYREEPDLDTDGINVCFHRNTSCNAIYWSLEKGEHKLISIEAYTAQFARVISLDGKINCSLSMILYQNDEMYKFSFYCEDEILNEIVNAAQNSLSQNSVDGITDCPSRERGCWFNDSFFSSEAEKLFSGSTKVDHNALENLILAPQSPYLPKGAFPMCYPADHMDGNYCPTLVLWCILDILKHIEYNNDDEDFYKVCRPRLIEAFDMLSAYENELHLLENLDGWVFLEWSDANKDEFIEGVSIPVNIQYYYTIKKFAEKENDEKLLKKAEEIKKTIIEKSFNGKFFEDNLIRKDGKLVGSGHVSETCQYYAFFFGLVSEKDYSELFNNLVNYFGIDRDDKKVYPEIPKSNIIVGETMRLELLCRNQIFDKMLDEIRKLFYPMAKMTGTLWEHCTKIDSNNHAFSSCCAVWIVKAISGYDNPTKGDYRFNKKRLPMCCEIKIPTYDGFVTFKY